MLGSRPGILALAIRLVLSRGHVAANPQFTSSPLNSSGWGMFWISPV